MRLLHAKVIILLQGVVIIMLLLFKPLKFSCRSVDYGVTFQNIENDLDPTNPDPVLWRSFFVSPVNKNMV